MLNLLRVLKGNNNNKHVAPIVSVVPAIQLQPEAPKYFTQNMLVKFPIFKDKLATRIYSELANKLRTARGTSDDDRRWKYYMKHNCPAVGHVNPIVITIKFEASQKRIRFIFNSDNFDEYEVQYHQKTNNIIEFIGEIHKLVNTQFFSRNEADVSPTKISRTLDDILDWGFTQPDNYNLDIHKVPAVLYYAGNSTSSKDCLYIDVIRDINVVTNRASSQSITTITSSEGREFIIVDTNSRNWLKKGDVILFNYRGEYNIMEINHTKKHVIYSKSEMYSVNNRIRELGSTV